MALVAAAAVSAVVLCSMSDPVVGVAAAAVLLVAALVNSPLRHDQSSSHWEAQQRHVRDGSIIIYWRPGCMYCMRLRLVLGREAKRAAWVDVWADPEGSAFVRDVNDGAETVPTVILRDGSPLTNPDPETVRSALAA